MNVSCPFCNTDYEIDLSYSKGFWHDWFHCGTTYKVKLDKKLGEKIDCFVANQCDSQQVEIQTVDCPHCGENYEIDPSYAKNFFTECNNCGVEYEVEIGGQILRPDDLKMTLSRDIPLSQSINGPSPTWVIRHLLKSSV